MQFQRNGFHLLVSHRGPLMLSQVLAPGIQTKQLEESFWMLGILIEPPPSRSVSQAPLSQVTHHNSKAFDVSRGDKVFNGHENRALFKIRLKVRVSIGPVGGGPEVDRIIKDEWEKADESETGDKAHPRYGEALRNADNPGKPAPQSPVERKRTLEGQQIEGQCPTAHPLWNGDLDSHVEVHQHAHPGGARENKSTPATKK